MLWNDCCIESVHTAGYALKGNNQEICTTKMLFPLDKARKTRYNIMKDYDEVALVPSPRGCYIGRESRRGWKRGDVCVSAFPFGVCSVNVRKWQRSGTRYAPLAATRELAFFSKGRESEAGWYRGVLLHLVPVFSGRRLFLFPFLVPRHAATSEIRLFLKGVFHHERKACEH